MDGNGLGLCPMVIVGITVVYAFVYLFICLFVVYLKMFSVALIIHYQTVGLLMNDGLGGKWKEAAVV
jgi:hypothetical protein